MEDIKKRISKLVDLKSIISIIMVAAMVAGFFAKMVSAEQFVPLVTMIVTFYDTEKSTEGGFREDLSRLSRRSQRNKKPPAMRVGKKSYTVESPFRIK